MDKAIVRGGAFKTLISDATRFPSVGPFAGANMLGLKVTDGKLIVRTFGLVLSRGSIASEGVLPAMAVDRRAVEAFASVCAGDKKVFITVDKEIEFRCGTTRVTLAKLEYPNIGFPSGSDERLQITSAVAKHLTYLAAIALDDTTRAELACVMMTKDGSMFACNQKAIAVAHGTKLSVNTPVPLPFARIAQTKNSIVFGKKDTLLKTGSVVYAMPTVLKAQTGFPLAAVQKLGSMKRKTLLVCSGSEIARAINECCTCLGQLSRTDIALRITVTGQTAVVDAQNAGAHFQTKIELAKPVDDATFRIPLMELVHIVPFLEKMVRVRQGEQGEIFIETEGAWVMFPSWTAAKGKKK